MPNVSLQSGPPTRLLSNNIALFFSALNNGNSCIQYDCFHLLLRNPSEQSWDGRMASQISLQDGEKSSLGDENMTNILPRKSMITFCQLFQQEMN